MKELFEMADLVKSGFIHSPSKIFGFSKEKDAKTSFILEGLITGRLDTDGEARKALYPGYASSPKRERILSTFNTLKNRLKEKLYDSVLFPAKGLYAEGTWNSAFIYCYRHFIIARLLLHFDAKTAGIALMRKVLNRAVEFELFEIAMLCTIALRRRAVNDGRRKEFLEYDKNLKIYQDSNKYESKIEGIYYNLVSPFATKLHISEEIKNDIENGLKKAEKFSGKCNTVRFKFMHGTLKILNCQVNANFDEAIKICDAELQFLEENKKMKIPSRVGNILMQKMESLLLFRDYNNAATIASDCVSYYKEGSEDWFKAQDLFFLICLNSPATNPKSKNNIDISHMVKNDKLSMAADIYINCRKNFKFTSLSQARQEKWDLYAGYLWFILTYYEKKDIRNRIFADKPLFSKIDHMLAVLAKDKKGANISYMVLKVALLLQQQKNSELLKNAAWLKNYLTNELRGEQTRDRLFIRLLIALIENDMITYKNTGRIKRLVGQLARTEIAKTATQAQVEIISYGKMWVMMEQMAK